MTIFTCGGSSTARRSIVELVMQWYLNGRAGPRDLIAAMRIESGMFVSAFGWTSGQDRFGCRDED